MPKNLHAQTLKAIGSDGKHSYYVVDYTGVSWQFSNSDILGTICSGAYLATLPTQEENDFLASFLDNKDINGEYWIGGYQDPLFREGQEPWEDWNWVTGESWGYTNWGVFDGGFEPNDSYVPPFYEPYLAFWNPEHFGGWAWNDEWDHQGTNGYIAESDYALIDISPGIEINSINCYNKKRILSVAVLSSECFDANRIDISTVDFQGAEILTKGNKLLASMEDVNYDALLDLVLKFNIGETNLSCESTEGVLTAETFDGILLEGHDAVNMVNTSLKSAGLLEGSDISQDIYLNIFPNPMTSETEIEFKVAEPNFIDISVYKLSGERIKILADKYFNEGIYKVKWDGLDYNNCYVSNGIYALKIVIGDTWHTKKIVVLK
jgi:hypothetical protein